MTEVLFAFCSFVRRFGERERPLTSWVLKKAFKFFLVLESLITSRNFDVMMSVYSNLKTVLKWTSCVSKHPAFFCDHILLSAKIS